MRFPTCLLYFVLINIVNGDYDENDIVPLKLSNPFDVQHLYPWTPRRPVDLPQSVSSVESASDAYEEMVPLEIGDSLKVQHVYPFSSKKTVSDDELLTLPKTTEVYETTTTLTKEIKSEPVIESSTIYNPTKDEILIAIAQALHWIYLILCFVVVMTALICLVYVTVLISNFIRTKRVKTKVYVISAPLKEII